MTDEYDPLTDDLIERLRRPKVTHHQISDAGEPYETISWVHLVECIKLEAADALEAKDAEIAALRADAERYIYLRDFNPTHILVRMLGVPYIGINSKEQAQKALDSAINAARGTR